MLVWRRRGVLYKAGFVAAQAGMAMLALSFCTPAWVSFKGISTNTVMGLWQACNPDLSFCVMMVQSGNPGWLKAVRALFCISMFFTVAATVIGLYSNFVVRANLSSDFFNKNTETSCVVSVVFGVFGLIVFASQVQGLRHHYLTSLAWGFILACLALTAIGCGAFLMLLSHRLQVTALEQHFSHRQLPPDFTPPPAPAGEFMPTDPAQLQLKPPDYEAVVAQANDPASPPPYSEVVKDEAKPAGQLAQGAG